MTTLTKQESRSLDAAFWLLVRGLITDGERERIHRRMVRQRGKRMGKMNNKPTEQPK